MIRIQITEGNEFRNDVDFIQVRNRDASARDLVHLVRKAMRYAPVLVNDRADVAIACGAAGVHLRSGSITPLEIKRLAPLIVTVACHSAADVDAAQGADYVLLCPIFPPLSKPDTRPPLGLENLRNIAAASGAKVIALGGITVENAPQCIEAGAAGIAGITLFSQTPAPSRARK